MGRFADPYGDDNRLPEGISCTGYDADTGQRYYVDKNDGSTWVGAPYAQYGVLKQLKATTAEEDNVKFGRKVFSKGSDQVQKREKRVERTQSVPLPKPNSSSFSRHGRYQSEDTGKMRKGSVTRPASFDARDGLSIPAEHRKGSGSGHRLPKGDIAGQPVRGVLRGSAKEGSEGEDTEEDYILVRCPSPDPVTPSEARATSRKISLRSRPTKTLNRARTVGPWPADRRSIRTGHYKPPRAKSEKTSRHEDARPTSDKHKSTTEGASSTDPILDGEKKRAEDTKSGTDNSNSNASSSSGHRHRRAVSEGQPTAPSPMQDEAHVAQSPLQAKKQRPILRQLTRLTRLVIKS